jgi:hypothetical protein
MKKNMGKTDKLIRLFVVMGIALLSYFEVSYNKYENFKSHI